MKYPHEVQQKLLNQLLTIAAKTEVGLKYEFSTVKNYDQFKNRVPIVAYEDIENQIGRCRKGEQNIFWPTHIKWFAKSSGTTNAKSKFIPVSDESLEGCHYKAGKDMLSIYYNNNKNTRLLTGKSLRLGGSTELSYDNKNYFGDLSAIVISNMPSWAEFRSTPSKKVALMSEWEAKMKEIVKEVSNEDITSLSGVPSWMLVLLQKTLDETKRDNIVDLWPNVEVYFHGGVSFSPYRKQYEKLFPKKDFRYYENYSASEGWFGAQDCNNSSELLLMLNHGIYYEFIPMERYEDCNEKNVVPLSEVELGKNYAIVISTNSGLWRYKIGDTVRFTSLSPYRIQVTGRTKHHINVFGEELIVENAEKALAEVSWKMNCEVIDYTVGPVFMDMENKGAHEWLIEFRQEPKDLKQFTIELDAALQDENSDYEAKRYKNMTLDLPVVQVAKPQLFHNWLAGKNKLGGQHKVPRLSNSRALLDALLKMNC